MALFGLRDIRVAIGVPPPGIPGGRSEGTRGDRSEQTSIRRGL